MAARRGRDSEYPTSEAPQLRHRSQSRRVSRRQRRLVASFYAHHHLSDPQLSSKALEAVAFPPVTNLRSGALREGNAIIVFSRTFNAWVHGEIVKFQGDSFVRVEYQVGEYWYQKTVHLHSEHLSIFSDEECDPGARPDNLFQGCRTDDPVSAEEMYVEWSFLADILERADIALISGYWLKAQSQQLSVGCMPLPRRQDLPRGAIIERSDIFIRDDVHALQRARRPRGHVFGEKPQMPIVAISHCWLGGHLSPAHPDPDGKLLRAISLAVTNFQKKFMKRPLGHQLDDDVAVFFSWCSVYQLSNIPTPNEMEKLTCALENMDIIYTHGGIHKWLFTTLCSPSSGEFHERGWPTWEYTVAHILMNTNAPGEVYCLDENGERIEASADLKKIWPLPPDEFQSLIGTKRFSEMNDQASIVRNYRRKYGKALSIAPYVEFQRAGWGDLQVQAFARSLPYYENLISLSLAANHFGDAGARALAPNLLQCKRLEACDFHENLIADAGAEALARSFSQCQKLKILDFSRNHLSQTGAENIVSILYCIGKAGLYLNLEGNEIDQFGIEVLMRRALMPGMPFVLNFDTSDCSSSEDEVDIRNCDFLQCSSEEMLEVIERSVETVHCYMYSCSPSWQGLPADTIKTIVAIRSAYVLGDGSLYSGTQAKELLDAIVRLPCGAIENGQLLTIGHILDKHRHAIEERDAWIDRKEREEIMQAEGNELLQAKWKDWF